MVQLADTIGERGVTFLMALSAGLLASGTYELQARRNRRALVFGGFALALPLVMLFCGLVRVRQVEAARASAPTADVALVQPSIGAVERWDGTSAKSILDRLTFLTAGAEGRGAQLTVWPEDAYPIPVAHASRRCPSGAFAILPYGVRGPVLTGMLTTAGRGDTFNSAAVCFPDGTLSEPYDKLHLLWFGETVPLVDRVEWIRKTFARGTGMLPGERNVVQQVGSIRASVLNCFEDTLPGAGRDAMEGAPNLLVNITNDAWFAGSGESELHLRLAVLRAVEERRDLVRAVNHGPTSWVDAAGLVRARYAESIPWALLAKPALLETPRTFFGRWGDAPTALVVVLVTVSWRPKRGGGRSARSTKRQGRRS